MGMTLIVPPADYPVTLEQAKANSRVMHDSEDALIEGLIAAATGYVEQYAWIAIKDQTWRLTLDAFTDAIELPRGPAKSVAAIRYYDTSGSQQTLSPDAYTVDVASHRQWIVRNAGSAWPPILSGVNAVEIDYVAGFSLVPPQLEQAILLLVSHWYKHREAVNVGNIINDVPFGVEALCWPYRRTVA